MFGVADKQRFIGRQSQQRFEVRIEVADDVLRVGDLHGVVAEQPPHRRFVEALAAALFLRPQAERYLAADALLEDGRFALAQVVEVLLVAAADDGAHEVEELLATRSAARAVRLDRLHSESAQQVQLVADIPIVLRHERHAAVVLPALRAPDPVGAQGHLLLQLPFSSR